MTTTWADLAAYIDVSDDTDNAAVEACFDQAVVLVDLALASAWREVPENVYDMLVIEVGSNLFDRRNSPSPNGQYGVVEGTAIVRPPRNPLTSVMPVINMFVVPL